MLIPIGFFGAGAAAGAYELISTTVLSSSAATVTFSSIDQTYKHLQIRFTAQNSSSVSQVINLTLNGSATGYARHYMRGNPGTGAVDSSGSASRTNIDLNGSQSYTTTANAFAAGVIDILDYTSTTKNKTVRSLNGSADVNSVNMIYLTSGLWNNTASVSTLTLTSGSGSLNIGSRFSLYGIKG